MEHELIEALKARLAIHQGEIERMHNEKMVVTTSRKYGAACVRRSEIEWAIDQARKHLPADNKSAV